MLTPLLLGLLEQRLPNPQNPNPQIPEQYLFVSDSPRASADWKEMRRASAKDLNQLRLLATRLGMQVQEIRPDYVVIDARQESVPQSATRALDWSDKLNLTASDRIVRIEDGRRGNLPLEPARFGLVDDVILPDGAIQVGIGMAWLTVRSPHDRVQEVAVQALSASDANELRNRPIAKLRSGQSLRPYFGPPLMIANTWGEFFPEPTTSEAAEALKVLASTDRAKMNRLSASVAEVLARWAAARNLATTPFKPIRKRSDIPPALRAGILPADDPESGPIPDSAEITDLRPILVLRAAIAKADGTVEIVTVTR